jgi:glycosyltransferase involved in cell wall biosynthesis
VNLLAKGLLCNNDLYLTKLNNYFCFRGFSISKTIKMEILFFVIVLITFVYFANIIWLFYGFLKIKNFIPDEVDPRTKFSVIIPFRNEEKNLPHLLNSLALLEYPKELFEVILVDDGSDFKFEISDFRFQISLVDNIRKTNSPKKDAINTAIAIAQNDWIITTDADCIVQKKWLQILDVFIQKNKPKMLASGIAYTSNNTFLESFQQLDLFSLQGTTVGSFGNNQAFLCNGANFCYQKYFFYALNGFEGNENIASGDDVFLLQKAIQKDKKAVHFLKSKGCVVYTYPENSWSKLFHQRVRWASKTGNYDGFYSKQLGLSVFLMNLFILFIFFGLLFGLLKIDLIAFFLFKFSIDFLLLFRTSQFFEIRLKKIFLSSLFYPFFVVSVVCYSFFGDYEWKGRKFKK